MRSIEVFLSSSGIASVHRYVAPRAMGPTSSDAQVGDVLGG